MALFVTIRRGTSGPSEKSRPRPVEYILERRNTRMDWSIRAGWCQDRPEFEAGSH